jgi:acyl-coenzyme A thioesterase PaaI-like protein
MRRRNRTARGRYRRDRQDVGMSDDLQSATGELSIQEKYYPNLMCFGCGHANERGLKLRSYDMDGLVRATFMPWPEHDNGGGFLNGGIISTLLDCHGGAAVLQESFRRGWEPPGGVGLPFVTAGLDVKFRRPTPLTEPIQLTAELQSVDEDQMQVVAQIVWEGKTRATGTALWKRWRPRS